MSDDTPSFLDVLREEAGQLVDSELPSSEELRSVVGALANRLERLEQRVVGEIVAPPEHAPNTVAQPVQPEPYVPVAAQQAEASAPAPAPTPAPVAVAPVESPAPAPVVPPVANGLDEQLAQARAALAVDQQRVAELEAQQSGAQSG